MGKIIIKMQCHARRLLVKTIYDCKKAEKKGLYSVQHNIRLYLTCRDWVWYQYYTMVKGESEKLKKRMRGRSKWPKDSPSSRLCSTVKSPSAKPPKLRTRPRPRSSPLSSSPSRVLALMPSNRQKSSRT